jgi:hypothetical protein
MEARRNTDFIEEEERMFELSSSNTYADIAGIGGNQIFLSFFDSKSLVSSGDSLIKENRNSDTALPDAPIATKEITLCDTLDFREDVNSDWTNYPSGDSLMKENRNLYTDLPDAPIAIILDNFDLIEDFNWSKSCPGDSLMKENRNPETDLPDAPIATKEITSGDTLDFISDWTNSPSGDSLTKENRNSETDLPDAPIAIKEGTLLNTLDRIENETSALSDNNNIIYWITTSDQNKESSCWLKDTVRNIDLFLPLNLQEEKISISEYVWSGKPNRENLNENDIQLVAYLMSQDRRILKSEKKLVKINSKGKILKGPKINLRVQICDIPRNHGCKSFILFIGICRKLDLLAFTQIVVPKVSGSRDKKRIKK